MRYFGVILSLFTAFVCLPSAQTQTFTILHTFQSADGANPQAGVIQDSSGNLYGTAENGGTYGAGTVYKITPKGKFSVLHSFGGTTTDGDGPTAPLLLDDNGNLYGTTLAGGEDCVAGSNFGCGTVFKINSSGKESILHDFTGGDPSSLDGKTPFSGLIADNNSDAMFGTTWGGYNGSVVYEITPAGKETILYTLNNNTTLYGSLVQDNNGDLWGTSGAPPATAAGTELAKSTAARFSNSTKPPKAGSKPRLIALLAASMEPIPGRALFMTASGASSTALPGWAALTRPAGTRRCWAGAAFCSSSIPPALSSRSCTASTGRPTAHFRPPTSSSIPRATSMAPLLWRGPAMEQCSLTRFGASSSPSTLSLVVPTAPIRKAACCSTGRKQ
jgi:uncharacterized repeat protein (TIGR03803 family)